MIYLVLLTALLNTTPAKLAKHSVPDHEWVVTQRFSFGAMDASPVDIDLPKYKQDSAEYKILQLALDIENVFPYDTQYESTYLSNIPKTLHPIIARRNVTYVKVAAAKRAGRVFENDATGMIDASASVTQPEKDVVTAENANRKELYALIATQLKLGSSDKDKAAKIYGQAIKYQKYYALTSEPTFTLQPDTHILTSMASSYKFKAVWDGLVKVLTDEKLTLDPSDINTKDGILTPRYKCGSDDRSFVMRLCTVKDRKLSGCKNGPKDESLFSYVDNGTLIWVEGAEKNKTLIITDDTSEDQEIKFCKNEDRKFDILEKLSTSLISSDPNKVILPTAGSKTLPVPASAPAPATTLDAVAAPEVAKPETKPEEKKEPEKKDKKSKPKVKKKKNKKNAKK